MTPTKRTEAIVMTVCGLVVAVSAGVAVVAISRMAANEQTPVQTEQISSAAVDLTDVPVAIKDIPATTCITVQNRDTYFVTRRFPPGLLQSGTVMTLDDLVGKRTTRRLYAGETVNGADVKTYFDPPDGTVLMTVLTSPDSATSGFTLPGYKVVIVATKKLEKTQKEVVIPILADVLILAVDAVGMDQLLSVAVTPEQSLLLSEAVEQGAAIRVELPVNWGLPPRVTVKRVVHSAEELRALLKDD